MRTDGTSEVDPERDYLRDQIRKLVAMVARLFGQAAPDVIAQATHDELTTQAGRLLGHPWQLLARLHPQSAAALLGHDPERILAYAEAQAAEARLLERLGDQPAAARAQLRAQALRALAPEA